MIHIHQTYNRAMRKGCTMTAQHTPGPWRRDKTNNIHCPGEDPEMTLLAAVRFKGGKNAEGDANARLIVAAPDMLEALRYASESLAFIQEYGPDAYAQQSVQHMLGYVSALKTTAGSLSARISAAIAKATTS